MLERSFNKRKFSYLLKDKNNFKSSFKPSKRTSKTRLILLNTTNLVNSCGIGPNMRKRNYRDQIITPNLKNCFVLNRIFEDKSCYKIELEMELVLDCLLSLYPNIKMSILSYSGNKMEILLLF